MRAVKGRVLVCTYHYAPVGTPRAIRWRNLALGLSRRGWEVHVLTIEPSPRFPRYDPEFAAGPGTVHRLPPGPLYRLRYDLLPPGGNRVRGNGDPPPRSRLRSLLKSGTRGLDFLFFPDKAVEWVPRAVRTARRLVREHGFRTIVTSGAPFSTHLVGAFLKRRAPVRWIADYGDPWSLAKWPARGRLRRWLEGTTEGRLLRGADAVVVTTEETRALFRDGFSCLSGRRIEVIPQGYDAALYPQEKLGEDGRGNGVTRVCHTGTFYPGFRAPGTFLEAVRSFTPTEWDFLLAGDTESLPADAFRDLPPAVRVLGHRSLRQCAALQRQSSLLLLFSFPASCQVPGKVYEYLAARRPILVLSDDPTNPAARLVVERHRRGWVVPGDPAAIRRALGTLRQLHQEGRLEEGVDLSPVPEHSWEDRVERFDLLLGEIDAAPGA